MVFTLASLKKCNESISEVRHIISFLALTFILSWILMGYVISKGGVEKAGLLIVLVMWVPGLTCLVYRFFGKLGFVDVGWRLGPLRYSAFALGVPLLVALLSYAISWSAGVSSISSPSTDLLSRNGVQTPNEFIIKIYPIIFLFGLFAALGEELGWRGFLIPKLYDTNLNYPLVVSSLIWGVWHFPLILWGGYATSDLPILSILLFMIMVLACGVFVGWLRMVSGSVWVAMIFHGAHNFFLQTAFEIFNRPGPMAQYLAGETGVIPCAIYLFVLGAGYKLLRPTLSFEGVK